MIDPLSEQIISLTDVAQILPQRRSGKRPHVSCIYRWTVRGCRGVTLESIQVGGTRCTTREAVGRFIERLSRESIPSASTTTRAIARRRREIERAASELDAAGY